MEVLRLCCEHRFRPSKTIADIINLFAEHQNRAEFDESWVEGAVAFRRMKENTLIIISFVSMHVGWKAGNFQECLRFRSAKHVPLPPMTHEEACLLIKVRIVTVEHDGLSSVPSSTSRCNYEQWVPKYENKHRRWKCPFCARRPGWFRQCKNCFKWLGPCCEAQRGCNDVVLCQVCVAKYPGMSLNNFYTG